MSFFQFYAIDSLFSIFKEFQFVKSFGLFYQLHGKKILSFFSTYDIHFKKALIILFDSVCWNENMLFKFLLTSLFKYLMIGHNSVKLKQSHFAKR